MLDLGRIFWMSRECCLCLRCHQQIWGIRPRGYDLCLVTFFSNWKECSFTHWWQQYVYLPSDKKPNVVLTQDPGYKVMFPGESVSYSCHLNVSSGWEYLYYKDRDQLGVSGITYSIDSVGTANRGSYTCQAKRGKTQVFFSSLSQVMHLEVKGKFCWLPAFQLCSAVHLWSMMIPLSVWSDILWTVKSSMT